MIKKGYVIYVRKSTDSDENQVASIPDQIKVLTERAKKLNLTVTDVLTETASAKNPGRPVFNELIKSVEKGEVDGILCWRLNRLARNLIDGGTLIHHLTTGKIREINTPEKTYLPTDNVLLMNLEFGMATQFSLDLGKDVMRGMTQKAERGLFPGRAPLGYLNDRNGKKGYSGIIPDPDSFYIIKKCWVMLLEEKTSVQRIYEVATKEWNLKSRDGKTPSRSQFYYLFLNPIYYGNFKWADKMYSGTHKPMITEEEFLEAQQIIQGRSKDAPRTKIFAYTGHLKCGECSSSITAENKIKKQKNGNVHHYTYYRCIKYKNKNCTQKCVREEEVETQLISFLESIEIPEDFHTWAMDKLRKENEIEITVNQKLTEVTQKGYNNSVAKLGRLIDMRASGEVSEEEYTKKQVEYNFEKEGYEKELVRQQSNLDTWLGKADRKLTLAETSRQKFESLGTAREKKVFIASLGSNLFLKDKKLIVPKENTLLTLKECKKEIETINSSLEPNKTQGLQIDNKQIYDTNPILCAYRDSNSN